MDQIEIRKVSLTDLEELQKIGSQTFFETFAEGNTEENMNTYLSEGFSPDRLKSELENPDSAFYFAVLNKRVIGYLKVNFGHAQTELRDKGGLEIERIYVLKEFYGKNIGQLLYNTALNIAEGAKVPFLWLGVWEKNPRAIHFYRKNGFTEFDKHVFKFGTEEQTDIMMKLELGENSL